MSTQKFIPISVSAKDIVRFWSKVVIDPSGCWLFQEEKGPAPTYGSFMIRRDGGGVKFKAHRLAYFLYYARDPEELCVMHKCDNPPCCNPLHLSLGTNLDNIADRQAKGRHGDRKGEKCGHNKLTATQVMAMRKQRDTQQGMTYERLAAQYGVSLYAAYAAIVRRTWKHI